MTVAFKVWSIQLHCKANFEQGTVKYPKRSLRPFTLETSYMTSTSDVCGVVVRLHEVRRYGKEQAFSVLIQPAGCV
jgi:hypothetical protein